MFSNFAMNNAYSLLKTVYSPNYEESQDDLEYSNHDFHNKPISLNVLMHITIIQQMGSFRRVVKVIKSATNFFFR